MCNNSILKNKRDKRQKTLDAFVHLYYLPYVKVRKRSWNIDEHITRKRLSPAFGHRTLDSIKAAEVEDWLNGLRKKGLSPASCNRYLAVFKSVCSYAQKRGFLEEGKSPCQGVSPFKISTQKENYLSPVQAKILMQRLEQCKEQEALVLRLLLLTGARKSEILHARWEDVNLNQKLLTVPLSKSGKTRHIFLSNAAIKTIKSIPKKDGSPWLFPGHAKNKPLSDIFLFWKKIRIELNLTDIRIHDLRHSFASFLVNTGHSLYEVQKMLGHGDPRTTMRYAHLGQDSLLAAANSVESICAPQTSQI